MTCTACGAEVATGAAFCDRCGARRAGAETPVAAAPLQAAGTASVEKATKACPYCGEHILEVASKCRFCGSDLAATPGALRQPGVSSISLNAPQPASAAAGAAPSIIIQNVQAQQAPSPTFTPGRYKNPGLALFFSIIFPGGGQFYNGQAGKGFLVLFTCWLIIPYIWSWFDAYSVAQRINRVGF